MRRNREHIDLSSIDIHFDPARGLNSIAMKNSSDRARHGRKHFNRKHNASFIVGPLHGDESSPLTESLPICIEDQVPLAVDRNAMNLCSSRLLQMRTERKHGRVFYC